jgi:hypothetical protein
VDLRGVEPLTSPVRGVRKRKRELTPTHTECHLAAKTRRDCDSVCIAASRCMRTYVGLVGYVLARSLLERWSYIWRLCEIMRGKASMPRIGDHKE